MGMDALTMGLTGEFERWDSVVASRLAICANGCNSPSRTSARSMRNICPDNDAIGDENQSTLDCADRSEEAMSDGVQGTFALVNPHNWA